MTQILESGIRLGTVIGELMLRHPMESVVVLAVVNIAIVVMAVVKMVRKAEVR